MKHLNWPALCLAAALIPSVMACTDSDDPIPDDPQALDPTEAPVEFNATVNDYTSGSNGETTSFSDNDKITVEHVAVADGSAPDWSTSHTAVYTHSGGKLTCQQPTYWSRKDETRHARAWYFADGHTSTTLPTSLTVAADQSSDATQCDFMYAHGSMTYGGAHTLAFHHQLSKVNVKVKLTGTGTRFTTASGLTLGNSDIALGGQFAAPAAAGEACGSWTPAATDGTVKPLMTEAPEGYALNATATLIPQDVTGKEFINVNMSDGSTMTWRAGESEGSLKPGCSYIYEVSVDVQLGKIEVKRIEGATWNEGENKDVDSNDSTADYGDVKIGDYYYSDGSWSDGGFIEFSTEGNGKVIWADPKPYPVSINPVTGKERKVVGIVFSTDIDRMGDAEKADLAAKGVKPHGLVLCAKILYNTQWDGKANDETEIGIPNITGAPGDPLYKYANAEISGLATCRKIQESRSAQIASGNYLAIRDMMKLEAPASSTGWFIPATGQWFDMLRNLTGMNFSDTADFYFVSNEIMADDGTHFDWQIDMTLSLQDKYKEDIVEMLNAPLSCIDTDICDEFARSNNFITCTLNDASNMYYVSLLPKFITVRRASKAYWIAARPMLAF